MLTAESPNRASVTLTLGIVANDLATAIRIVGFHEYSQALQRLDRFLTIASPLELRAADEIVKSRNEFTVFTHLARLEPRKSKPTSRRNDIPEVPDQKTENKPEGDEFERRGLGWITAVARVELQAVLAAFTSHQSPFMVQPPTAFDVDEYENILFDGMQTHYWRLQNDPTWRQELKAATPTTRTLAYLRRLTLLNSFTRAVFARMSSNFDQNQVTELESRLVSISNAGQHLQRKVSLAVNSSPARGTITASEYRKLLRDCQSIKLR